MLILEHHLRSCDELHVARRDAQATALAHSKKPLCDTLSQGVTQRAPLSFLHSLYTLTLCFYTLTLCPSCPGLKLD